MPKRYSTDEELRDGSGKPAATSGARTCSGQREMPMKKAFKTTAPKIFLKKMPRIICIDYGKKRTGIATTDPLKIIATALTTVETKDLVSFLKKYFLNEEVELILIGEPKNLDDSDTHATPLVNNFIKHFIKTFPAMKIEKVDERYTSKLASRAMIDMGMKKKERQKKGNTDQIAATIMLQEYMEKQA